MAAGTIITVLSSIPWGQVVDNAPKIADGAAKLWNAVTNRKSSNQTRQANAKTTTNVTLSETEMLKDRLVAMEDSVLNLQDQMRVSTELIKALAEQNAQLVQRIDLCSVRVRQLAAATAIAATLLMVVVAYLLLQQ